MAMDNIGEFTIKQLFTDEFEYSIPIYQRNYAWEAPEIEQLIQDVFDFAIFHPEKNYYIGTLVVSANKNDAKDFFDTIDGQQRLTTLSILCSVIKNEFYKDTDFEWFKLKLGFESRQISTRSLEAAYKGEFLNESSDEELYKKNIKHAYEVCQKYLLKKEIQDFTLNKFASYLINKVILLRVPLPKGIDLNHYFEIMNSRGEQLEKHEILKAKLMSYFENTELTLREKYFHSFNLIWEACANMEKYVQLGFNVEDRHNIFGRNNWNTIEVESFDELVDEIDYNKVESSEKLKQSIEQILQQGIQGLEIEKEDGEIPEKFNTVVNFQNFLLHVLKVQTKQKDIALDDKGLLDTFEKQIPTDEIGRIDFSKRFIFNLLRCKFLFDKYVIKRELSIDKWSLKSLRWYSYGRNKQGFQYVNTFGEQEGDDYGGDNRRVLMLLAMFHVSLPSQSYKYWLNATMQFLFDMHTINSKQLIEYLEHIAKRFVYDRMISKNAADYYELVYDKLIPIRRDKNQLDINKTNYYNIENNLLFNYVDYVIWLELKDDTKDFKVKQYEFSFRSSVEHFYPQNPYTGKKLEDNVLHNFGNLCLISHAENSSISNRLPHEKGKHFLEKQNITTLKLYLMYTNYKFKDWNKSDILNHQEEINNLLSKHLDSNYTGQSELPNGERLYELYLQKDKGILSCALLSIDDLIDNCGSSNEGLKYNMFDFEQFESLGNKQKLINILNEKTTLNTLEDFLEVQLSFTDLEDSYRYLLVRFPQIITCEDVCYIIRNNEDNRIGILYGERISSKNYFELFTMSIYHFFNENRNSDLIYYDEENWTTYFSIGFVNNEFILLDNEEFDYDEIATLNFSNHDGLGLNYWLDVSTRSDSKAYLKLIELGWIEYEGKKKLKHKKNKTYIQFDKNIKLNFEISIMQVKKILKDGLKINL
jgi:uncharacterized protein with ParB-like and HNH nuclease domain